MLIYCLRYKMNIVFEQCVLLCLINVVQYPQNMDLTNLKETNQILKINTFKRHLGSEFGKNMSRKVRLRLDQL